MTSSGELAVEILQHVRSTSARSSEERKEQLRELEEMVKTLEGGSSSLNQRATTLAALAVAALGAFGIFASRISSVQMGGMAIAAGSLLGIASLALLVTAGFALWSARPGGKWSENFASRAEVVIEGRMEFKIHLDHLVETVKLQLKRNHNKARRMKRAYDSSAIALVTGTSSVIVVLVDALIA